MLLKQSMFQQKVQTFHQQQIIIIIEDDDLHDEHNNNKTLSTNEVMEIRTNVQYSRLFGSLSRTMPNFVYCIELIKMPPKLLFKLLWREVRYTMKMIYVPRFN